MREANFTEGGIAKPLMRFALPVLAALLLQAMYGAVDLMIVGLFSGASDVSAVATGSQVMMTVTSLITGLAMGLTVLLGQRIGEGDKEAAGVAVGAGVALFAALGLGLTALILPFARPLCVWMRAPEEAFGQTLSYVRICSAGALFIVAYNVLGSVFRGMGDARMPLLSVLVACVVNVAGDLLFVAVWKQGAAGAAVATVLAQGVSVLASWLMIRRQKLPFHFKRRMVRFHGESIRGIIRIGTPIALQDLLVSVSFLAVTAIVNGLGLIASAGVGVADRLCGFIMLVPSAFMQAMSAFVAQNWGARKYGRARKAMVTGMLCAFTVSLPLAYMGYFHGDLLSGVFARDPEVIAASWEYLRAFAIDTLLTSFMFCFVGYFNGCGRTSFVMAQGIFGAFCVRIPVSFLASRAAHVSLFAVGLATPCSTAAQIILCAVYYWKTRRANMEETGTNAPALSSKS